MGCIYSSNLDVSGEKNLTCLAMVLENSTKKTAKKFFPKITYARCIDVYDGDTCTIAAVVQDEVYQFSVRMFGYDSAEIKTKDANEKMLGNEHKKALSTWILDKMVRVEVQPTHDKFGRVLAVLYDIESGTNINEWMISKGYGKPYEGGTKQSWKET